MISSEKGRTRKKKILRHSTCPGTSNLIGINQAEMQYNTYSQPYALNRQYGELTSGKEIILD